jgi:hypothetical protein
MAAADVETTDARPHQPADMAGDLQFVEPEIESRLVGEVDLHGDAGGRSPRQAPERRAARQDEALEGGDQRHDRSAFQAPQEAPPRTQKVAQWG